ncbi:MAG: hypothetical protein K2N48_13310 [Muribaculaceae bacterium]|nr:hypothetical protein [Muribaculaceae bacterium]
MKIYDLDFEINDREGREQEEISFPVVGIDWDDPDHDEKIKFYPIYTSNISVNEKGELVLTFEIQKFYYELEDYKLSKELTDKYEVEHMNLRDEVLESLGTFFKWNYHNFLVNTDPCVERIETVKTNTGFTISLIIKKGYSVTYLH